MAAESLDSALSEIFGGRTAKALARAFGMSTVADLLSHYPRRYAQRGELTALADLPVDENVTIVAEVRSVQERPMRARRGSILEVQISDGRGHLTLTFFNQAWRAEELKPGIRGVFAGKVSRYRGAAQLAHPDYELFEPAEGEGSATLDDAAAKRWAETPIPIYPASGSMASWQLQKAMAVALDALGPVPDPVPEEIRAERGLLDYATALRLVHQPENLGQARRARAALRFQEAFVLQSALLAQRARRRAQPTVARPPKQGGILTAFDTALPYQLTGDQRAVGAELSAELSRPVPMNRLVQGEVGSGKTLVAVRAMLQTVDAGGQAALLAPTEVLASQHLRSIVQLLGPELSARLHPTLLTGQLGQAERRRAMLNIVSGEARIVLGTHALLGENVSFFDLGLVVVDEQHRFGVEQREALRLKASAPPHVLVLTATPIPRTVAMTVFGDLDVSVIAELPAGRPGIESHVVPLAEKPDWLARVWQRLAEELAQGRQAFVVCPVIDSAEASTPGDVAGAGNGAEGAEAAEHAEFTAAETSAEPGALKTVRPVASVLGTAAALRALPVFAEHRIEILHGRMSAEEKDAVMRLVVAGEVDIVVSTTVIEVGVDVPNASSMVVLDADRFGVSQLHQLRGRVGRGSVPGLALFVTHAEQGSLARDRVDAVAATLDGFALAQVDLELRQEGDVLGSSQSGARSSLRLLRVVKDAELISEARAAARPFAEADPELADQPILRAAIERRLGEQQSEFLAQS